MLKGSKNYEINWTLMIFIMAYLTVFIVLLGYFGCTKSQIRQGKAIFFSTKL